MKTDKAIDEIRAVRKTISAELGHDTVRLIEHYRQMESRYRKRIRRVVDKREPVSA